MDYLPFPARLKGFAASNSDAPKNNNCSSGDEIYAGELGRAEIRPIVASTLDVSEAMLKAASKHFYVHSQTVPHEILRDQPSTLNHEILEAIPRFGQTDTITRLFVAFAAGREILEGLNRIKRGATRHKIAYRPVEEFAHRAVFNDLARMTLDVAVFESNVAITEGLIQTSDLTALIDSIVSIQEEQDYCEYLQAKYPVLISRLRERARAICEAIFMLLERLGNDLAEIARYTGNDLADLVVSKIHATSGDSHNGAQSVCIIEFSNSLKIVYKPRGTKCEAAFQQLLSWLNLKDPRWTFKILWVLSKNNYGWVEFVESTTVDHEIAISRYYERYGALIAVLNAIGSTDVHHENLIAAGEHPVIVDLESILQPIELIPSPDGNERVLADLEYYARTALFTAMVDPAFLDRTLSGSPLNANLKRTAPERQLLLCHDGSLSVNDVHGNAGQKHCVRIGNDAVEPTDYIETILRGYRECATVISLNRAELLNGVLEELFGNAEIRVIFRPTVTYSGLSVALNSAYAHENLWHHDELASKLWLGTTRSPSLRKLIAAEYNDLWRGDVPYFRASARNTSVIDSGGQEVGGVLRKSGMDATRERLCGFSTAAISQDLLNLEYCLKRKFQRDRSCCQVGNYVIDEEIPIPTCEKSTQLLDLIAKRILIDDNRILCMDIVTDRDLRSKQSPIGSDFYSGLPGVCFALSYHAFANNNVEVRRKIRSIVETFFLNADEGRIAEIGACHGLGGWVYLASHLQHLYKESYFSSMGEYYAQRIARTCYKDRHFDLFSGAAGAILSVISLLHVHKTSRLEEIVEQLCEHLQKFAIRSRRDCISWISSIPSDGPTSGFAHGASGIGFALLKAYHLLKDHRLLETAYGIDNFLKRCYDRNHNSWNECVEDTRRPQLNVWCHGAPGITHFYSELAAITGDPCHVKFRDLGLDRTVEVLEFENDSLCHGTLGNADLLISRAKRKGQGFDSHALELLLQNMLEKMSKRQPRCGNDRKHRSLSLFTGLAGIAYQLMRAKNELEMPSVITFEPPCNHDC